MLQKLTALAACVAFVSLALGLVSADADARGMTPWDVARIQSVGTSVVSPDGSQVAYTLNVPRIPMEDENGKSWTELHVYDIAAGASRPYITGEGSISAVRWTPDGSYISFLSKRGDDEKTTLYVLPAKGGEARALIAHDEDIAEYAFNASASRVIFLAKEPANERIEARKEHGFDVEVYEETARSNWIYGVEVELGDWRVKASDLEPWRVEVDGHAADLQYSPKGEQILVTLAPTSRIDDRYMARRFHVIDVGTGNIVGQIETEGKLGGAAFSPDGKHVAFVGSAGIHDPAAGRLMVAPTSGGAPTELLPDFDGHVRRVAWVDAKTVLYHADVHVHSEVGTVGRDGKNREALFAAEQPVLSSMSVSADGKQMSFVGSTPTHPNELFVARDGAAPERVTDSNPWLAEITFGDQNVHEWTARDGLGLEGVLISPVDYDHTKRYPLLVVVHGGPEAHESNGWKTFYSRGGQFMAAQGYFVWFPNYRGSTGRGVDFTLTSQGDPGGKEFDDIVDGVEDLIELGLVERGKVGITGGSYGGFASAWGATKLSEHYQAAVMFVGISEQYSKFGTTDIPRESQLVHQNPRKVYDDWEFFLDRSPIFHAKGSKTPLLILHGKDDPRVHPTQSMIMYRYFEHMADAPVRLVWYPGEGHGNRKAAGRLDYSLRLMRWMNHFLIEGGTEKPAFELDYEAVAGD